MQEVLTCWSPYFNPRSHEGSDSHPTIELKRPWYISILAPTRGATTFLGIPVPAVGISILAPTRGATVSGIRYSALKTNFNPRSHEGSDTVLLYFFADFGISILAPTRGATSRNVLFLRIRLFQSSLPRGERLWPPGLQQHFSRNFNPRSHEGSDGSQDTLRAFGRFQSSLPRGERLSCPFLVPACHKFQSSLPRGERREWTQRVLEQRRFQSSLPRGERLLTM